MIFHLKLYGQVLTAKYKVLTVFRTTFFGSINQPETKFTGFYTVDGFSPITRWLRDLRKGVFKTGQQP